MSIGKITSKQNRELYKDHKSSNIGNKIWRMTAEQNKWHTSFLLPLESFPFRLGHVCQGDRGREGWPLRAPGHGVYFRWHGWPLHFSRSCSFWHLFRSRSLGHVTTGALCLATAGWTLISRQGKRNIPLSDL